MSEFSGILCVDEVYQDKLALLFAVDPAAPDGDRLVGYQLVHGTVDATITESFLTRLKDAGVQPDEVISDGSALYPTVFKKLWPEAAHQLCLFHETRRVTKATMEVVQTVRKTLPTPPPLPGRGWGGPLRDQPPTDDPTDPSHQRWQLRQATRQAGIAQVHALAQAGESQRSIARRLGLHRQTVKTWLQLEPPAELEVDFAENWHDQKLPDVSTMRRAKREVKVQQVHELHKEGLTYSEIARCVGIHRVTVSKWLTLDPPSTMPEEIAPERAGLPPPPDPWQSWDQVRGVGEALRTHRFLLLRRPDHLNEEQQAQVDRLLESPVGPQLQCARSFLEEWYRLWRDELGQRRTVEEARSRYDAWRSNVTYRTEPALRRVLDQMTTGHFERLSPFLQHPDWEATNNGAERIGRGFRHQQAPHFNLRSGEAIESAIVVAAFQKKAAVTATPNLDVARSARGRKARTYGELAVAA